MGIAQVSEGPASTCLSRIRNEGGDIPESHTAASKAPEQAGAPRSTSSGLRELFTGVPL